MLKPIINKEIGQSHGAPTSSRATTPAPKTTSPRDRAVEWHLDFEKGARPSDAFLSFQHYLFRHGNINLARLEDELRTKIQDLVGNPGKMLAEQKSELAHELLLRYCFAWAMADQEDAPPLLDDSISHASDLVQAHHKQMTDYSGYFQEPERSMLADPEHFGEDIKNRLVEIVQLRRVPKGVIYKPSPLFMEPSEVRLKRDWLPNKARKVTDQWGFPKDVPLMKQFGETRGARFWLDELADDDGINCPTIQRRKF